MVSGTLTEKIGLMGGFAKESMEIKGDEEI